MGQCLFHSGLQALFFFFFWSTKPPNWLHHVCNRPHAFDMDTSRDLFRWVSPRIKSSRTASQWKQDALNIKEQRLQRQTQLKQRGKKKKEQSHSSAVYALPHGRNTRKPQRTGGPAVRLQSYFRWLKVELKDTDLELDLQEERGGAAARLQITKWD